VGGFVAALLTIYLVGVILDVLHTSGFSGGELYGLASFRIALSVQFLFLLVGTVLILMTRRKVRRQMAAQGVHVPPLLVSLANQRRRRVELRRERLAKQKSPTR
jgi:hypothetical protein